MFQGPGLTDCLAQTREIGCALAARKSGTPDEFDSLNTQAILADNAQNSSGCVADSLNRVFEYSKTHDQKVTPDLLPHAQASADAVKASIDTIHNLVTTPQTTSKCRRFQRGHDEEYRPDIRPGGPRHGHPEPFAPCPHRAMAADHQHDPAQGGPWPGARIYRRFFSSAGHYRAAEPGGGDRQPDRQGRSRRAGQFRRDAGTKSARSPRPSTGWSRPSREWWALPSRSRRATWP